MHFLQPQFLIWSLLALIPLLLYFFRRKSKTVEVSTLVFFKSLAQEHQESAWLRNLKKILSLLLTLLVILGAVFALMRVVFAPKEQGLRSVVILLDRSASMAAVDDQDQNRLEIAKKQLQSRLEALPENVAVSLIAYDSRPVVLQPKTLNRRELEVALSRVEIRPVADHVDAALTASRRIAKLEMPSSIWHVSDHEEAPELPEEEDLPVVAEETGGASEASATDSIRLEFMDVGINQPINVGITAFDVRKIPLEKGRYEAFLEVSCSESTPDPVEVRIEMRIGGGIPVPRDLDLKPGEQTGITIPLEGVSGQELEITLSCEGDRFPLDDHVLTQLPENRPIVVAWVRENNDPFTAIALAAMAEEGELDIYPLKPAEWPVKDAIDLVIFEGWVPDEWPEELPAIVISPNQSSGPVHAKGLKGMIPHDMIRVTNDQHPVLFRVASGRIAVTQSCVIDTSGSLEPLWFAGSEPILAAGEVQGKRLVIFAFAPEKSEQLPLTASYPLLLGNSIYWCADSAIQARQSINGKTGDVIPVPDTDTVQWKSFTGDRIRESSEPVKAGLMELDRIGLWTADDGRFGSALLLAKSETNFPKREVSDTNAAAVAAPRKIISGDITWMLLWIILGALLIESWLFHRHALY